MEWPFVWKSEYDRVAFLLAQKDRDFWDVSEERDDLQEKLDNADVAIRNLQDRIKELTQEQDRTREERNAYAGAAKPMLDEIRSLRQTIKTLTAAKPKKPTVGKPKRKIVKKK